MRLINLLLTSCQTILAGGSIGGGYIGAVHSIGAWANAGAGPAIDIYSRPAPVGSFVFNQRYAVTRREGKRASRRANGNVFECMCIRGVG